MKVYVTARPHHKYNYLMNWTSTEGHSFSQWFTTMKELKEYISGWNATIVFI